MGMPRLMLFPNPLAGAGQAPRHAADALRRLHAWHLDVVEAPSPDALTELCAALDPHRYTAAVTLGGDGTINYAMRGLLRSGVPLYAFPCGTANDLATELGLGADWNQVERLVAGTHLAAKDIGEVNGVPFVTTAGVGVGAAVVRDYNDKRDTVWRRLPNCLAPNVYSYLAIKHILAQRHTRHRLSIVYQGRSETMDLLTAFICNQRRLGRHLMFDPLPGNEGGGNGFDVFLYPAGSRLRGLRQLWGLRRGAVRDEDVLRLTAREFGLESVDGADVSAFGDGEILTDCQRLSFHHGRRSLTVYRELPRR